MSLIIFVIIFGSQDRMLAVNSSICIVKNEYSFCRNPDTYNRPSFSDISSSLSLPDKQLLMINKEDPVTVLGGALETSHSLYTDLQYVYMCV